MPALQTLLVVEARGDGLPIRIIAIAKTGRSLWSQCRQIPRELRKLPDGVWGRQESRLQMQILSRPATSRQATRGVGLGLMTALAAVGFGSSGCSTLSTTAATGPSSYAVRGSARVTFCEASAESLGNHAVQLASAGHPSNDATERLLTIEYPHPNGRRDIAQASLVVIAQRPDNRPSKTGVWQAVWQSTQSTMPGLHFGPQVQEAWALDISAAEFDMLLSRWRDEGYFDAARTSSGQAVLIMDLDGQRTGRYWPSDGACQTLAVRVANEGRLVSCPTAQTWLSEIDMVRLQLAKARAAPGSNRNAASVTEGAIASLAPPRPVARMACLRLPVVR